MSKFKTKAIYFDLDGTVADLYNTDGWLESLESESPVFAELKPLIDMQELQEVATKLFMKGYKFGVITHLPMNCTPHYARESEEEKRIWCRKYLPFIQEFHAQAYGLDKFLAVPFASDDMLLIDDNSLVRTKWMRHHGCNAIDPTKVDIIKYLKSLL